jgi:pyruvate/2-oxoglutarate dehydrogenase complex dihydrolipoamide acyltransferase (E2) component
MGDPVAVVVPQVNPNDDRAVLVAWHVGSGARLEADAKIATLETTKTTFDVHAPASGYVVHNIAEQSLIEVGTAIAWIYAEAPRPGELRDVARQVQVASAAAPQAGVAGSTDPSVELTVSERVTRKARRRMRELGLTETDFPGEQRVDLARVEGRAQASHGATLAAQSREGVGTNVARLEQSASKIIEAAALAESYRLLVPSMVTVSCDAQLTREHLSSLAADCPVSLLELVIHEAAKILAEFRELNGFFSDAYAYSYDDINIGFAINAGRSLKVPVVRNANTLSQREVAQRVRDLTLAYMRNELSIKDLTEGTFTVTDLSTQDVVHFAPVVGPRQSAILGVCAERQPLQRYDLVLAFDHRMSDGMRVAHFLRALRMRLERRDQH